MRCLSRFCRPSQPLVACSSHRTLLELQHSHPERIPQKLIPQSKFIFGERGCTKFAPLNLTSHLQAAELGPNAAEHTHTSKSPLAADTPRLQAKEMRCVSVTQPYAHRGREKGRAQGCHRGEDATSWALVSSAPCHLHCLGVKCLLCLHLPPLPPCSKSLFMPSASQRGAEVHINWLAGAREDPPAWHTGGC